MQKYLGLCLNLVVLVSLVLAEVPSYISVCGRRNPNLNECVKKSADALRPQLRRGIPELDAPSIEPLVIQNGLPLADSPQLKAYAYNVKLWNVSDFQSRKLEINLERMTIDFDVYFDSMKLQGDYDVRAKIIVPVHERGPVDIIATGISAQVQLRYRLIKTKAGQQLYFTAMTTKLKISDYVSKFVPREGPDAAFAEAINTVLNTNRQEIIEGMMPGLEKAISTEVLKMANAICKNFTYDELFPDRE